MYGLVSERRARLSDLRLVVRENQIQTAAVDVKLLTKVLGSHRGALHMPSGETFAPRARPVHNMFRARFLPQRKVVTVFLFALSVQLTRIGHNVVEIAAGELAVRKILGVFLHVHIHRSVGHIGIALIQDLLHERNLLDDVSRSVRLDGRRQDVQRCHVAVVAVGVELHYFHRLQLLQTRFLGNLVLSFVCIVLQVTHIRDIAHVAHFVAQILQIAIEHIKRDRRARMTQMGIAVHRRSADIHTHMSFVERFECLLEAC